MQSDQPIPSEADRLKAQQDPNDPAKHNPELLSLLQQFFRSHHEVGNKLTQQECLGLATDLLDVYIVTPKTWDTVN